MTTSDRIVRRFLASQPLDDKMKALLLKLRKGADASLTMGGLMKLLTFFGGWKVEKGFGLIAEHHNPMRKGDEYELLAEESEQSAIFYYEKLKQDEVSSLPTNPAKGKRYVMDLEPLHNWRAVDRQVWGAKYKMWTTVPSLTFTDPKGKTFEALPSKWSSRTEKDIKVGDILKWMKAESTYLTQINEILGMEAHEPAVPRTRDGTGT